MTITPLTTPIIDILGLSVGVPTGTNVYPAVDVLDPTQSPQGTTKQYTIGALFNVFANALGFSTTVNAIAASTANYNVIYNNGSSGINATLTDASGTYLPFVIDGTPGVIGNVYLIKNQISQFQNGLYVLIINGDNVSVPWQLIRYFNFNSPMNIVPGQIIFVVSGATQTDTSWQLSSSTILPILVGTTNLIFNQISSTGYINQYFSSLVSAGTAIPIIRNTPTDITTISLPSGDWDIYGNVTLIQVNATTTGVIGWCSLSSATLPNAANYSQILNAGPTAIGAGSGVTTPMLRYVSSLATTVYLGGYMTDSAANGTICGEIQARRRNFF